MLANRKSSGFLQVGHDEGMTETGVGLMALLRRLDDPQWLEWPQGYNCGEAAVSFERLLSVLDADFQTRCTAERTGDSSEYGRIHVPAEATECGTRIVVQVSKFQPLAMVSADNPGAFFGTAHAQQEGELDAGDLAAVEQALTGAGYVVVPEELLEQRYDGPAHLIWNGTHHATWWDRYFGSF